MFIPDHSKDALEALGRRLREERLRRNESQKTFAARIGASIPTLQRMEAGDANVQIRYWLWVLEILSRTNEINHLLSPPEDLFAKYEYLQAKPKRKRASRLKRKL